MFKKSGSDQRLALYRDVLAVYKGIIEEALVLYGLDIEIVQLKNSIDKNPDRAPMIILERGDMQHIPRSLLLSENANVNLTLGLLESKTAHLIEYPIEFSCYGNSYLEAEKLGGLAMEAILTTGMSIVKKKHANIIGSEFVGWGKSGLAEGSESSLVVCKVFGKVFLQFEGIHTVVN